MGKPIALKGHHHTCPMVDPGPKPHIGGPVSQTQSLVKVNGIPVAVVGDKCICIGDGLDTITSGSSIVRIDGKAVARLGDSTGHGGVIVQGEAGVKVE
jgi:uncharacterized Zn-binding protein involved in type VI secretion